MEHDSRLAAEKKIESTEQALITLSQENAALQAKLDETHKKLEASDAALASLRKLIIELLTSVFGKLNTRLCCYQVSLIAFTSWCRANPSFFLVFLNQVNILLKVQELFLSN